MDHVGILKRAWSVTWRYRILWLFGLFVSGGGGGGGGGNYLTGTGDAGADLERQVEQAFYWVQDNIAVLISIAAFLFVVWFALFLLSVAAKGGLVHLVNEAEEDRPVRGIDGWAAGFRAWFRVFGITLVLWLPFMVILGLILLATLAPLTGSLLSGGDPGVESILGMCGGLVVGGLILLLLGVLLGLLDTLAVRHTVLGGTGVFRSIGEAWTDVRTRFKDIFVMWLLMFAVGIGFGIVVGVIAAVFGFAVFAALIAEAWYVAIGIGVVLFLALLLPSAIYGAFSSAVWTIFFRRLSGREVLVPQVADAAAAPAPALDAGMPAPPAPPAPAAPAAPGEMPPPPQAPTGPPIGPWEPDEPGSRE